MATEKLIAAVSAHEILYNPTTFAYRDNNKKHDAWLRVSEVVGEWSAEECKKKWKGLRDTLRKERKKRKKERDRRRSGAEGGPRRQWRYLTLMAFVVPFMEDRKTSSNMEGDESEEKEGNGQDTQGQREQPPQPPPPQQQQVQGQGQGARKRQRQEPAEEGENLQERMLQVMEAIARRPAPPPPVVEDADALFFKSLLEEIRPLSAKTRQDLKFNFYKMVYEAKQREAGVFLQS
ncbi:uncharacterized protein PAE49_008730 [Odontesthes bonariensis]|uniref:uncharacterized protein LOC142380757 n=1 Tax=Odontesthes bonariensis TaxID=219752 RepID=UPI003F582D01